MGEFFFFYTIRVNPFHPRNPCTIFHNLTDLSIVPFMGKENILW